MDDCSHPVILEGNISEESKYDSHFILKPNQRHDFLVILGDWRMKDPI